MNAQLVGWTRRATRTWNVPLVRSGGALILSNVVSSALGFLYWIAAARSLSVADIGLGASAVAGMMLIKNLSLCGANHVSVRYVPVAGPRRLQLARRIQLAAAGLGATGGMVFLVVDPGGTQVPHGFAALLVAGGALLTIYSVQDSILVGLGRAAWVPLNNALYGLAKIAVLFVMIRVPGLAGWEVLAWSWVGTMVVGTIAEWLLIERFATSGDERQDLVAPPSAAALARFALANHLGTILLRLPPLLYPLLILRVLGEEASAYFYTSWMIANVLMMSSSNISSAMIAQAALPGADVGALFRLGIRYTMALVLPGVAALIVLGKPILWAFGSEYQQGYGLLVILAIGCLIYPVPEFYVGIMRVRAQLRPVLILSAIAGALTLGLAVPLGATIGLAGFGWAFVAGQCVAALMVVAPLVQVGRRSRRAGAFSQRLSAGLNRRQRVRE